jgi:diguanylate cyclase (GGDEF)-like protein
VLAFALATHSALALNSADKDPPSPAAPQSTHSVALRTITTLREAHSLSLDEARRGYPVHVRAVVTYYDRHIDPRRIAFYLHDSTGAMYASVPLRTTWTGRQPVQGTLVDVTGITAPGDYAPILDRTRIVVVGDSHLPHAKPVSLTELLTGSQASQWVEMEGVVHSVIESDNIINLQVGMRDGILTEITVRQPGVDYQSLVDKLVRIRGNAGPIYNANHQLTGVRLYFPGMNVVSAKAPDSGDAHASPVRPVSGLLGFDSSNGWPHRVHIRGTATLYWPNRTLCIQDATGGLCAQTTQSTPLAIGSPVDLIGFAIHAGFKPALSDATFQPRAGHAPVAPVPVTPQQALQGNFDSGLVQIEGKLIGRDLATRDTGLILSSGNSVFRVFLPASSSNAKTAEIQNGSRLRITGICSVEVDNASTVGGFGLTQASRFSILLTSPSDIVVLAAPSWWTASRIGFALLVTLAVTVAGIGWVVVLRRRVEQQTRELRESRERYRHMAHHDALTGLPTRILLHSDLKNALHHARRFHKSIALLMLDLDKFKQINDCFGHDGGDHVLRITAKRISAVIRSTDRVARMGGDEFIVLLNDLTDPGQAAQIAEKIMAALSAPIHVGRVQVPLSVSIGICTITDEDADAEVLLKRVDAAMYRAKQSGRGCFQVFTADMLSHVPDQSGTPSAPSAQATLVHS